VQWSLNVRVMLIRLVEKHGASTQGTCTHNKADFEYPADGGCATVTAWCRVVCCLM
jgi:hypothetical protein